MTLTTNTQIPTAARAQVRSLVKAHQDWPGFLVEKNLVSASARNADLLEFAMRHAALANQIEALLGVAASLGQDDDSEDMQNDAADTVSVPQTGVFEPDTLLASVDQFLSPLVRKELLNVLTPVIAAANKPAVEIERVVEVERIVEVAPGETPRIVNAPKARRDKRTTFRTLFPSRAKDPWRDAPLTLWTGVAAPATDPFYVVNHINMAMLMTAIERQTNVWLTGPAGTGKSTMPEQAAAILGRPFVKLSMTRHTEVDALTGGMALRNGATLWDDGALIKAMRAPGTIICLDELTFAPPGVQAIFQAVTDNHRSYTLPTGEVVRCAEGVVFVTADNTAGSGDEGGLYAGTNVSNAALITRFLRMIHIGYLSAKDEAEALANHTGCAMPAAEHVADFVARARKLPALAGIIISLRQMVGFVQVVQDGFSAKQAFDVAISSRMPATEKAAIEALMDLTWSSTFEALLHGKTAPAQPSDSAASKAFADENY